MDPIIPINPENETIQSEANTTVICKNCSRENTTDQNFCVSCGYPIKGSEEDQNSFDAEIRARTIDLEEAEKKVKSARNTCFWLGGLSILGAVVVYSRDQDGAALIVNMILCAMYFALAFWTKYKPFAAILTTAILYFSVHLISAFVDPKTIFSGIILKVVFIGLLVNGVRASLEAEKLRKRLNRDGA